MTKGEDSIQKRKCKNIRCSALSKSAWCDLNDKGDILIQYDKCPNRKCNFQKIVTFTPHQHTLWGGSIKSKLQKTFRGTQTVGINFSSQLLM